MVPTAALAAKQDELRAKYAAAKPFPFVELDDLWDDDVLSRIDAEFPKPEQRDWLRWQTEHETKETSRGIADLSPFTQEVLQALNGEPFLEVIRAITGIDDLIADPTFYGAGLHEAFRGGWLNVHGDWIRHPDKPLARRVNLLTYLNKDWDPVWGGALELWDPATKRQAVSFPCSFNRTVMFNTTSDALHGFPRPLSCPVDRSRRLISVYYWSDSPELVEQAEQIVWHDDPIAERREAGLVGKVLGAARRLFGEA